MLNSSAPLAPLKTFTTPVPPSLPVRRSALPSPLTSPAATKTPSAWPAGYAWKLPSVPAKALPLTPLKTRTRLPPPGPVAVTMSEVPSPLTSARATRTPPRKEFGNGWMLKRRAWVAVSQTRTRPTPPASVPVTSRLEAVLLIDGPASGDTGPAELPPSPAGAVAAAALLPGEGAAALWPSPPAPPPGLSWGGELILAPAAAGSGSAGNTSASLPAALGGKRAGSDRDESLGAADPVGGFTPKASADPPPAVSTAAAEWAAPLP